MHHYLQNKPFDIYSLHLFLLVAKHRSFTRAAREAGVSQSALTRQIQGLEKRLGVDVILRTTRSVGLTDAGDFLRIEAGRLIGGVATALEGLAVKFEGAAKAVRVGVSRTITMAHLPGVFRYHQLRHPDVSCRVTNDRSGALISALDAHEIDVAIFCPPTVIPRTIHATHRFQDRFSLIASSSLADIGIANKPGARQLKWLSRQPWLTISEGTNSGKSLRHWLKQRGLLFPSAMEFDSFDPIISLISSGMGVAMVPERALALYRRRQSITVLPSSERFSREVVVATRRHRKQPVHITHFIESILF